MSEQGGIESERGMTTTIDLNEYELWYLVQAISAGAFFPPLGSPAGAIMYQTLPADHREEGGGIPLRVRLLAAYMKLIERPGRYTTIPFELNLVEAWIFDQVIWNVNNDIHGYRFPDGGTLFDIARKVWNVLLVYHQEQIPAAIMPEGIKARDNGTGISADQETVIANADAAIASVERAIAESRKNKSGEASLE